MSVTTFVRDELSALKPEQQARAKGVAALAKARCSIGNPNSKSNIGLRAVLAAAQKPKDQ